MTIDTTKLTTLLGRLMILCGCVAAYGVQPPVSQQVHDWAVFLGFTCGGLAHSFSQGTAPTGQEYVTVETTSGNDVKGGPGPNPVK